MRPFWGRLLVAAGAGSLVLYLVFTAGIWGVLTWRGYPVTYADVAWPPAWSHFPRVKAQYFAERAQTALARGDVPEAMMSLSIAYTTHPSDYDIGRLYARLSQAAQPALADRIYAQLVRDHPARRSETLGAWYEALLWRGDFPGIIALSRQALSTEEGRRNAWASALLFAVRREPNAAKLRELAADPSLGVLRDVLRMEVLATQDPGSARLELMRRSSDAAAGFGDYYRVRRLIDLGFAKDALAVLSGADHQLPPRDVVAMKLDAYAALGSTSERVAEAQRLLQAPQHTTAAEILAAHLIRHPDPKLLALGMERFAQLAHIRTEDAFRIWMSWLAAAGVCRDFERLQFAAAQLKSLSGAELKALNQVQQFFRGEGASNRVEVYLPAMQPLPLSVTYALLERYYTPRQSAPAARP